MGLTCSLIGGSDWMFDTGDSINSRFFIGKLLSNIFMFGASFIPLSSGVRYHIFKRNILMATADRNKASQRNFRGYPGDGSNTQSSLVNPKDLGMFFIQEQEDDKNRYR